MQLLLPGRQTYNDPAGITRASSQGDKAKRTTSSTLQPADSRK